MKNYRHFYFLSWEALSYSRTGVLYYGLVEKGLKCQAVNLPQRNYLKVIKQLKETKDTSKQNNLVIVGSPCSILAILCRIIWPKSIIIYDSGWPLIDGLESRKFTKIKKLGNYIKIYLVDFIAYKCSNIVALESEIQKKTTIRKFLLKKSKVFVSYTGINEVGFEKINSQLVNCDKPIKKVIFRGKYNLESGLEFLAKSSHYLDLNTNLVVICPNIPEHIVFSSKVKIISNHISDLQLATEYKSAHIALGQLGNSDRIFRTIPHKFYEAIFFDIPYLTKQNSAIREVLPLDNQAIYMDEKTPAQFGIFLAELLENQIELENKASKAKVIYLKNFSQSQIVSNFLCQVISKLNSLDKTL